MSFVLSVPCSLSLQNETDVDDAPAIYPQLPTAYIKVIPHPHSHKPSIIIPLDGSSAPDAPSPTLPQPTSKPWAPFRNLPDFQFTERAVKTLMPAKDIDGWLYDIRNSWSRDGSNITFKNHTDMDRSLNAANDYFVPVCSTLFFLEP